MLPQKHYFKKKRPNRLKSECQSLNLMFSTKVQNIFVVCVAAFQKASLDQKDA